MIFAEKMNQFGFKNLNIFATDHDSANNFGDVVTAAIYSGEELQRTPVELLGKYFEPADKPGYLRVVDQLPQQGLFPVSRPPFPESDRERLLPYSLQERPPSFSTRPAGGSVQDVSSGPGAGRYLATENTQKLPPEVAHLFTQVVHDAQLLKKVGE